MCDCNYKLQLIASFIIFPQYNSNDGLRVILYLRLQLFLLLFSFIYIKGSLYLNEIVLQFVLACQLMLASNVLSLSFFFFFFLQ